MLCPCGTGVDYEICCGPIISGTKPAPSAEALMRSRYSAHVVGEIPWLRESIHPDRRRGFDEKEVRKWANESEWLGLEILSAKEGSERATVEFVARYRVEGRELEHHEVAKFRKDKHRDRWYFLDGDAQVLEAGQERPQGTGAQPARTGPKIGRNEPCPCGSGKKFKKCCGAAA